MAGLQMACTLLSLQCYSDETHKLAKYLDEEKLLSIVITDSSVSEYYKDYKHGVAQPGKCNNYCMGHLYDI